ncbi:Putative uncharacterized protein [Desulfurococcus amylolyticus 1221n]|uniref:Major facilitator superfamily MFS_1 n=1 Tax=Desulfurococcus amylolyticus (strain DSM 18924 / JCM 16383 / VKM B-2413 / 1221n) TaxID=490899 RepID=B8D467_DESA1|nr:hypothetical protein [Desulfurococcus amylolyticus]ACL10898.1 Putative uncharacterized protein [Desulfurococcus amylolyticus 1221n]
MDLPVAALNIGLASIMDLLINLIAVKYFNFSVVELGLLNALWTIVFIPVVRIMDRLADAGRVRLLWYIGSSSMALLQALMYFSLIFHSKQLIYVTYMIHTLVFASTRLAVNTYIFETRDSGSWSKASIMISRLRLLSESVIILSLALVGFSTIVTSGYIYLAVLFTLLHFSGLLVIYEPRLKIERVLYRLESMLGMIFIPVKGLLTLSYLEINSSIPLSTRIYASALVPSGLILLALVGFRLSNEYLWTPLPYYLTQVLELGINDVLMVYGLGRLIAFSLYIAVRSNLVFKKGSFAIGILVRLLVLMILNNIRNSVLIGFLLGLIYLANDIIDSNLFLAFAKNRGGYGVGLYSLIGEIISLVGSASSGYIYAVGGSSLIAVLTTVLSMLVIPVVLKSRSE